MENKEKVPQDSVTLHSENNIMYPAGVVTILPASLQALIDEIFVVA